MAKPIPSPKSSFSLRFFWRDMSMALKGIVMILLPLLLLLGSLSLLYSKEIQLSQLETQLRVALQNQRDIQAVHTQLLEASNGVRDFLLTDDTHFLDIFYQSQKQIPDIMGKLTFRLETTAQKERLERIKPLVAQSLNNLNDLAKNQVQTDSNTLITQFKKQVSSLDQLRNEIEQLNKQEAFLVDKDQNDVALQRERNFRVTLFVALTGIIGSVITLWIFLDSIVSRVRALRDSARHLAKAEPLDLPFSSRDELGQLSDELDQASQLLANKIDEAHVAKFDAEEANHAKTMFLSRTSHELRTPLNAILGFAQLLEAALEDETKRNNATMIKSAGEHLLKLINDVLDIASIESGEHSFNLAPTDINSLIHEAVSYMAPLGRIRNMQISQTVLPNLIAYSEHQKLLQVMLNLLSNALKYGPASTNITINAYTLNDHVLIEVIDQGTGIPQSLRARLFSPFDRLGAEQTSIEGSGLGLALSQQIMTALRGTLTVANQQSLFRITIPMHAQTTLETSPSKKVLTNNPSHALPSYIGKQNILLVEDNASNKTLVEAILQREENISLLHSSNLTSAHSYLSSENIALVILDLHLPDSSGESLVNTIKQDARYNHIPILVLSADAMPETISRVQQMGVDHYATKPLDVAAFTMIVRQLLAQTTQEKG